MIEIDGSYGEGGGQIIRTALALSMLTQQPFRVINIRKGRDAPGLKAQHLEGIRALQQLSSACVEGAALGSTELAFTPAPITKFKHTIDIGTAGSITLLLQSLLLPCSFAAKPVKLTITGGTDVAWAMPSDYFQEVLLPQLTRWVDISCKLLKRGYYPKGGGTVELQLKPRLHLNDFTDFASFWKHCQEQGVHLNLKKQGTLFVVKGVSHAAKSLQQSKVAERQADAARLALQSLSVPVDIRVEYADTLSPGSGIMLRALYTEQDEEITRVGADALGARGTPAETVGTEAAKRLLAAIRSNAPVDAHLADNLIPWMALFKPSTIVAETITPHTKTNIAVVEQFFGKCFELKEKIILCK